MPSFVTLQVRDLEHSVRWYRDVLGFQVVFASSGTGPTPPMAHIRWTKYADVLLRPAAESESESEHERGRGVSISFQTPLDQVDALAARAADAGAQILASPINRPWNTRDFFVADPDGYRLAFTGGPVDPHMSFKAIADQMGPPSLSGDGYAPGP